MLTGGPGAAPGGVASKNGWVYMRVRGESISYSPVCPYVYVLSLNDSYFGEGFIYINDFDPFKSDQTPRRLSAFATRGAVPCLSKDLTTTPCHPSNRLCKWEGATLSADRTMGEGAKRKWEGATLYALCGTQLAAHIVVGMFRAHRCGGSSNATRAGSSGGTGTSSRREQ